MYCGTLSVFLCIMVRYICCVHLSRKTKSLAWVKWTSFISLTAQSHVTLMNSKPIVNICVPLLELSVIYTKPIQKYSEKKHVQSQYTMVAKKVINSFMNERKWDNYIFMIYPKLTLMTVIIYQRHQRPMFRMITSCYQLLPVPLDITDNVPER